MFLYSYNNDLFKKINNKQNKYFKINKNWFLN